MWERERGGDRVHAGSAWKRWANERDHKNDGREQSAKRMTLGKDGTIRGSAKKKTKVVQGSDDGNGLE